MPAEAVFEGAEERRWHRSKIPFFDVTVLHIVGDAVRKDVFHTSFLHPEAMALKELTSFAPRITIGYGAAALRFGIFSNELLHLPELTSTFCQQNPRNFVGAAVVDHNFDRRRRTSVLTQLLEDGIGMWRVVNHAEGVDQIVRLDRNEAGEFFGVARAESNSVFQPKDGGACAGQLHGFLGEIDGGYLRSGAGIVNRICPNAAADFEHLFAAPPLELCKPGDMVFHEVLAGSHLVKVFLRADGCSRMTNVTRATIPVVPYPRDFDFVKAHVFFLPSSRSCISLGLRDDAIISACRG